MTTRRPKPPDLSRSIEELRAELAGMERFVSEGKTRLEVLLGESAGIADIDKIRAYIKKPWCVLPKGPSEYYLVVPAWSNVHAGWLHSSTDSYRVFIVDRYSQWFGQIPEVLRGDLDLGDPVRAVVKDGILEAGDAVAKKLKEHLGATIKKGEKWKVKAGHEFDLLADLIEMGAMPFVPQPVQAKDIRAWKDLKGPLQSLRDYQKDGWHEFLLHGAIGVYWPMGAGKTVIGVYALARISGQKLVVVPSRTMVEQWRERIESWGGRELLKEVDLITYASYHKVARKKYTLAVFDECLAGDTILETEGGRTTFTELDTKHRWKDGWNEMSRLRVRDFKDGENRWAQVRRVYKAVRKTLRARTSAGRDLVATPDHHHMVLDLSTLNVTEQTGLHEGDFVAMPLRASSTADAREHPADELLGWFIGDGHMSVHGAVKFSFGKEPELQIGIVRELAKKIGLSATHFVNSRGDHTTEMRGFRERLGWRGAYGNKARTVRLPAEVFAWDASRIGSLLRGLFDSDGSISSDGRVQYNTTSRHLAHDVDQVLQKLGIVSRWTKIETRNSNHGDLYRCTIPPFFNDRFEQHINFRIPWKQYRLRRSKGTPSDAIPVGGFLSRVLEQLWITEDSLAELMGLSRATVNDCIWGRSRIGQHFLARLSARLRDWDGAEATHQQVADEMERSLSWAWNHRKSPQTLTIRKQIEGGRHEVARRLAKTLAVFERMYFVEVKKVSDGGEQPVYDFETDSHTFVANGLLTHNCHRLPANTFSRFATVEAKYRMGLSATPFREDGRTNYIIALTGRPVGVDWDYFIREGLVRPPDIRVRILKNQKQKFAAAVTEVESAKGRRLVFSDSLEIGRQIAKRLGCPFVSGETDDRLKILEENKLCVVSRVGDEGVSLPDLRKVVELDFHGGSRRQSMQRVGRLFHRQEKGRGEHVVLMTEEEYRKFGRRFLAIEEKGLKVKIHDET